MKELSVTEVQAVSGAGWIQDYFSGAYGDQFSRTTIWLNKLFKMGYSVDAAQKMGQEFGSRLGKAIEDKISDIFRHR